MRIMKDYLLLMNKLNEQTTYRQENSINRLL